MKVFFDEYGGTIIAGIGATIVFAIVCFEMFSPESGFHGMLTSFLNTIS